MKKTPRKTKFKKLTNKSKEFKEEFNKQLLTAITAAFAFLIALSWREPISESLNKVLEPIGETKTILIKFVGAIIITLISVLIIMLLTKKLKKE